MAVPFGVTTTPAHQIEVQYRRKFWTEYVRTSGFKPYMKSGDAEGVNAVIHVALEPKKGGNTVRIPLLTQLYNRGASGSSTLVGREEPLGKYSFNAKIEWRRHAVATEEREEHFSFIKAVDEVRPLLKQWAEVQVRDEVIDSMSMVVSNLPGTADVCFAPPICNPDAPDTPIKTIASAAQCNAYFVDNADRVQMGLSAVPTFGGPNPVVAGNFAASLANVAAAGSVHKAGAAFIMRMKYLARHARPLVRPIRTGEQGREYYVAFCDSDSFDQYWNDADIKQANIEARSREGNGMEKNPIFQDGDLLFKGVIIREIPEMLRIDKAVWGTPRDVGRTHLCGTQASVFTWGMEPDFRARKEDDYGHIKGVGLVEARGCQAIQFDIPVDVSVPAGPKRKINLGRVDGFVGLSS